LSRLTPAATGKRIRPQAGRYNEYILRLGVEFGSCFGWHYAAPKVLSFRILCVLLRLKGFRVVGVVRGSFLKQGSRVQGFRLKKNIQRSTFNAQRRRGREKFKFKFQAGILFIL
jgi:hypothetical protein